METTQQKSPNQPLSDEALELEYNRLLSLMTEEEQGDYTSWNMNLPMKIKYMQSYLGESRIP